MSYTFEKVTEKNYVVRFEHNGKPIEFNGIVANNESELNGIVQAHIAYLDQGEKNWVQSYAEKRRSEYPLVEEYIDGLVKGNQAQMQAYIDKCLAIKVKYPKK